MDGRNGHPDPAGAPPVALRGIDDVDRAALLRLRVAPHQARFVPGVAATLEEAAAMPEAVLRAVCRTGGEDSDVAGVVMYALDRDDKAPWIYRLLIDAGRQGQGIGGAALEAAMAELARVFPLSRAAFIGVRPENTDARALYTRHGFEPDGRVIGGEIVLRRALRR